MKLSNKQAYTLASHALADDMAPEKCMRFLIDTLGEVEATRVFEQERNLARYARTTEARS